MSNKLKKIDIKNRTYYFLDVMINTKILDPNKMKIFIYHIGYVTVKDLSYSKINTANLLCLIFD